MVGEYHFRGPPVELRQVVTYLVPGDLVFDKYMTGDGQLRIAIQGACGYRIRVIVGLTVH